MQAKLQRQEAPYRANRTKSWSTTAFTDLMKDFDVSKTDDDDDNFRIARKYNLAVSKKHYYRDKVGMQ